MSNDFVHVYNRDDSRCLYYDFKEKAFYRDRSANEQFKPNLAYFLAIVLTLGLNRALTMDRNLLINISLLFLGMCIATFAVHRYYRKTVSKLLDNQTVEAYLYHNELDVLMPQARKLFRLQLFVVVFFGVAFIVCSLIFIIYVQIALLLLSAAAWSIVVLFSMWTKPYKKIMFFKQYKKGEISI